MPQMGPRRDSRWAILWICVILALSLLPYLLAWLAAPDGLSFGGILYNPLDGNSYLAKMLQGWQGGWLFHLPFTEEPHDGAFIFTFYLLLGHAARLLGLSLPLVFHAARVLASAFMLAMFWRLLGHFFADAAGRKWAFLFLALGAGFGWLFPTAEPLLPDLWIPEAFTFYSALSNPHFPLALGLMACIAEMAVGAAQQGEAFGSGAAKKNRGLARMPRPYVWAGVCGLALAVVQPFAVPVMGAVLGAFFALRLARRQSWRSALGVLLAAMIPALPVLAYDWWVYGHNWALAAWSAQNVTASPPAWHWLVAYGLLALLAFVGIYSAVRKSPSALDLPALWLAVAAVGMYVPFALQRRFSMGLQIPVTILAAAGLETLTAKARAGVRRWALVLTLGVASLSAATLLMLGIVGGASGEPRLFLSKNEAGALGWLREGGGRGIVLASPQLSAFVPAWAGNPVVYGHPYETIRAVEKKAGVERFFGDTDEGYRIQFLKDHRVAFLIVGSRERALASDLSPESLGMVLLFSEGAVEVWAVEGRP